MMRRAVFSGKIIILNYRYSNMSDNYLLNSTDSQRKGLEKRFQMQKYISKPDRKKLAERLGLKDSQVIS